MIVSAFYHAAMIRLLIYTESPLLCGGLCSIWPLLKGLLFGHPILTVLGVTAACFVISTAYFWLLNEMEEGSTWWLLVMAGIFLVTFYPY